VANAIVPNTKSNRPLSPDGGAPANWFVSMSMQERRTLWACLNAWTLDAMAVQIYVVVMPTLILLWGLSKRQAGMLGTSALLVSSLGGWIAGILSDRYGRVRVLRWTVIWFTVFTVLSGLTHSYGQLLLTRSLQGLGFGGEWAAGGVLISEVIAKERRGRAAGTVASGWALGYGAAVLLYSVVFSVLPPAQAWRVLFFLGLIPAIVVLWICRNVEEPSIYLKMKREGLAVRKSSNLLEIFQPALLKTTLTSSLLAAGALGGNYTILTWLPTYLKLVRHLSVLNTGGYLGVNICGSFFGYVLSAHLSDWLGRKRTFAAMGVCAALTLTIYTLAPLSSLFVLLLGFPLGFFQSGIISGMSATFAELFPTRVRGTGQGFSYNSGRGLGSFVPLLVGYVGGETHLGGAIGVCALCSYGVFLVAVALLPETRGRELGLDPKGEEFA
jgi:MFS family permease